MAGHPCNRGRPPVHYAHRCNGHRRAPQTATSATPKSFWARHAHFGLTRNERRAHICSVAAEMSPAAAGAATSTLASLFSPPGPSDAAILSPRSRVVMVLSQPGARGRAFFGSAADGFIPCPAAAAGPMCSGMAVPARWQQPARRRMEHRPARRFHSRLCPRPDRRGAAAGCAPGAPRAISHCRTFGAAAAARPPGGA